MCIKKVDDNAFLILRMTFGCTNGPFDWPDIITEPATDLCNDLLSYSEWDENTIFSPNVNKIKEPITLNNRVPFLPALTLDINVPCCSYGKSDDFVDDVITAGFLNDRWKKLVGAALF